MITSSDKDAAAIQDSRAMSWNQWELENSPLVLEGLEFRECISGLSHGQVKLSADIGSASKVVASEVIGKNANIRVNLASHPDLPVKRRYFGGIVSRFAQVDADERRVYYEAEIVPWLWLLSQHSDCRIFQDLSAREVILQLLSEMSGRFPNVVNYEDFTSQDHPSRDCIVQYNETDLNLLDRLAQDEGIRYYFEHGENSHTMILRDDPITHPKCPHQSAVKKDGPTEDGESTGMMQEWHERLLMTTGSCAVGDTHFQRPYEPFRENRPTRFPVSDSSKLQTYEHPASFSRQGFDGDDYDSQLVREDSRRYAELRIQREESRGIAIQGASTFRAFSAGYEIQLKTSDGKEVPYLLTEVIHSAKQEGSFESGGTGGFEYQNQFECMPTALPYRPPRETVKPVIAGFQTAIVQGPTADESASDASANEEIHVDEHGRVRVLFAWDREGRGEDGTTSAWLRVGQGWASGGFGMHFWPRVGDEVMVAFADGDPDRPIVVGSLYNGSNRPPYALPEHKTRCGIKTRSSTNGSTADSNELRFEDKKDKEQIYIHAERNLDTVVESCESRCVGGSRSTSIHKHEKLTIAEGNRSEEILKGNDELRIHEGGRFVGLAEGDDELLTATGHIVRNAPEGQFSVEAKELLMVGYDQITMMVGGSSLTILPDQIVLSTGGSTVALDPSSITSSARSVRSVAAGEHVIKGLPVKIN